jgi:hypothetical protein
MFSDTSGFFLLGLLANRTMVTLWSLPGTIQKYLFFSLIQFEFSQFSRIIFLFSTFSQQIFEAGFWEVRLSGFYRHSSELVACVSLPRLIFNEIFLGISI